MMAPASPARVIAADPVPPAVHTSPDLAVQVCGLVKQYRDGVRGNRGIDLQVYRGEIVSILGPNGAGKTTFLRQLTTEMRPTSGAIRVFGIDAVTESQRAKRLMGITPQEAGLFDSLTVTQHLELFGRLKGLRKGAARTASTRLIEELGLGECTRRRVGLLSGGQRRRVLVGLALLGDPPLLVLDEPTTGLDPVSRRSIWRVLRRVVAGGASVVLSTHYIDEAERVSDRIAIINAGQLIAFGTMSELVRSVRRGYRLNYHLPSAPHDLRTDRCATVADARARVESLGLVEYSIARASLEDVYFEMVGEPFPSDELVEASR